MCERVRRHPSGLRDWILTMADINLNGIEYEWTHAGIVGLVDDMRYIADDFGDAVIVPFCGREDEYLEH